MTNFTAERLRQLVHYDAESGIFTRLTTQGGGGSGWPDKAGYLYIMVGGKIYAVHRLAWLYMTGDWPVQEIDHINGDKADNRFANLRDVSRHCNMQNELRPRKNNTSGFAGVRWRKDRQRWIATILVEGKPKRLGAFDTAEAAHAAYVEAKRLYHSGFSL